MYNLNNLLLRLQSVSVESVLKRGFAWVKNEQGQTIYNTAEAQKAKELEICFADGSFRTDKNATTPSPKKKTGKSTDEKQIDLFNF